MDFEHNIHTTLDGISKQGRDSGFFQRFYLLDPYERIAKKEGTGDKEKYIQRTRAKTTTTYPMTFCFLCVDGELELVGRLTTKKGR